VPRHAAIVLLVLAFFAQAIGGFGGSLARAAGAAAGELPSCRCCDCGGVACCEDGSDRRDATPFPVVPQSARDEVQAAFTARVVRAPGLDLLACPTLSFPAGGPDCSRPRFPLFVRLCRFLI
jgi:hypothetical protein